MEFIIEFILDIIFEGMIEGATSKRVPLIIRILFATIIVAFYVALIGFLVFASIYYKSILLGALTLIFFIATMIGIILKIRKYLKQK